jgi:hypothetical protein
VQEVASSEEDQPSNLMQTLATNMLNLAGPSGVRIANPSVASAAPVLRTTQPEMAATVKELRTRIGSIKKTMKITTAMKLVAAAKVRKAQEACTSSRPFTQAVGELLSGLVQRLKVEKLDIPLLEDREVKTVGLMVVTGDRGLCGGYNAAAIKKAQARIDELTKQGINVEIIGVGTGPINGSGNAKRFARQSLSARTLRPNKPLRLPTSCFNPSFRANWIVSRSSSHPLFQ